MKTASFFTYTGHGRISIARFAPRRTPSGFRVFKALAPGPWFRSVSQAEYIERFSAETLSVLDAQTTWDAVHTLASGAEPVLLCWEKPGDTGAWCHRALVAQWFQDHIGHRVDEIGHEGMAHPLRPVPVSTAGVVPAALEAGLESARKDVETGRPLRSWGDFTKYANDDESGRLPGITPARANAKTEKE